MNHQIKKVSRIIALFLIVITSSVSAQPPREKPQGPPPPPRHIPNAEQVDEMVQDMAKLLELNSKQTEKIEALFTSHFKDLKECMDADGRPERKELKAIKNAFEEGVKAELTSKQKEKYDIVLKLMHMAHRAPNKPCKK